MPKATNKEAVVTLLKEFKDAVESWWEDNNYWKRRHEDLNKENDRLIEKNDHLLAMEQRLLSEIELLKGSDEDEQARKIAARNETIVMARRNGRLYREIAQYHNLTIPQVQHILKKAAKS
jgi:hypothetical protein